MNKYVISYIISDIINESLLSVDDSEYFETLKRVLNISTNGDI